MNIGYRKIAEEDKEYIKKLIEKNLKDVITISFKGYFDYELYVERASREGDSFIILYNSMPCGFIWYTVKGLSLHVNTIVIDKKYQGKGIGTSVFKNLEVLAGQMGLDYLQLGVQGINKRALKFYKRLGFYEMGYTKEFDTYYMQKKLK